MKPANAKEEFEAFIRQSASGPAALTPAESIRFMLAFYREKRADGCLDVDGDMLLYHCTTDDSDHGRSFQFDITRQFIESGDEDEDGMSQLSLTCHFPPSAELDELNSDIRWCRTPAELGDFERWVIGTDSYRAVANATPQAVSLQYINV